MSENEPKNSPDGKQDDGFGLPPMSGGGLPPAERAALGGMGAGMGGSGMPMKPRAESTPDLPEIKRPKVELTEEELFGSAVAPATVAAAVKPPTKAPEKDSGGPKHDEGVAGVVDTFEAIVIALILALTFRAFVVEAFVIPTGSMAPTLLGAHFEVICPKCGMAFAENTHLPNQVDATGKPISSSGPNRPELVDSTRFWANEYRHCPNCGYEISSKELPDQVRPGKTKPTFVWANNGDRILVMKYLYSVTSPKRYDVIVFKEPMNARDNYIKRLIGLPGETIEIINGDIFVGEGPDGAADQSRRFIARKPKEAQDALWQLVYDNDRYPIDEGKPRTINTAGTVSAYQWHNPWKGKGWEVSSAKVECASTGGELEFASEEMIKDNPQLVFYTMNVSGYNPGARSPGTSEISQAIAAAAQPLASPEEKRNPVGDLHLESVWTPKKDGQKVTMTLGKKRNQWRVTLEGDGQVGLERMNFKSAKTEWVDVALPAAKAGPATRAGVPMKLEMNNVDRCVEFYVDGALLLRYEQTWTAADALAENQIKDGYKFSPDPERPMVAISTDGGCTLGHLKLMRDIYYTQWIGSDEVATFQSSTNSNGLQFPTACATLPLTLHEDEFFALGDNSTLSLDGRGWSTVFPALDDLGTRHGVVPRRYLLGKAFFVYWPAGFRVTKTASEGAQIWNMPVIPNTGEMRLIR